MSDFKALLLFNGGLFTGGLILVCLGVLLTVIVIQKEGDISASVGKHLQFTFKQVSAGVILMICGAVVMGIVVQKTIGINVDETLSADGTTHRRTSVAAAAKQIERAVLKNQKAQTGKGGTN